MTETALPLAGLRVLDISSFIAAQVRWMMRLMPDSPTNMWCASSVSMNLVVRASGSKLLSASAQSSW